MLTNTRWMTFCLPFLFGALQLGCGGPELSEAEAESAPCLADSEGEGSCQEELLAQAVSSPAPGYRITTPFGKPGSWAAGYHTGDDYASPTGTKVIAITGARVIEAAYPTSWGAAYGRAAIIQAANGRRYLYAHLSRLDVSAGQTLSAGRQIGLVGTTGNVTGPHLHFEMRVSPYRYGTDSRKPTW
jgi:murein DD-endopeptidase MepM/ murein hydrolase activator NlpD